MPPWPSSSTQPGFMSPATPNDLRILVGGSPATIEFAGLVGNGLYQFNIIVPNLPDGEHSLAGEIGGVRTQTLRLVVRRP